MRKPSDKRLIALLALAALLCVTYSSASAATLTLGSRGERVALIQQRLKTWGYYTGAVDGIFGRDTYNAVVRFQRQNGLTADGKVGPKTAAALGVSITGTISASLYRESELSLLSRLVNGEARGEPYIGQVAVAAVVLNRVSSDEFPDTISGVIFQPGAFDAVWDGQFDMEPTASCVRAARDAMNGWDPTGGCTYYYNPATATNEWIWSRTVQLSIGRHAFAI
ncbi:MAG: spore cortex-lytic enzyme [Clostridiales bacterium]|nr:spore cortex-lytic enzyme [Clostridiales bacterium]